MLYADAARRFNFLAGLGIGAILGAGLAMLAAPQKRVRFRNLAGHAEAGLARGEGGRPPEPPMRAKPILLIEE